MTATESWPTDADGKPLAKITSHVQEKIPTAPYASVDISKTVTKFVPDDKVVEGLDKAYEEADASLQPKRDKIIDELGK